MEKWSQDNPQIYQLKASELGPVWDLSTLPQFCRFERQKWSKICLLLYFQTFDFLKDGSLSVLYVEAADDDVEQGDDEDNYLEIAQIK